MNQDKKLRLLLVPLIFMVILHVPVMIQYVLYECMNINILASPEVIRIPFAVILWISAFIWFFTFYHIPVGIYTAMLVVYTVVSWAWILMRKKGYAMYLIKWIVLCVLSIILYWKYGDIYYCMFNG